MFRVYQFENEVIPRINVLRESDIFNFLAMVVFDGYLPKQRAIDLLSESIANEVPPELMTWARDFIKTCFCLHIKVFGYQITWFVTKNRERVTEVLRNNRHWDLAGFM